MQWEKRLQKSKSTTVIYCVVKFSELYTGSYGRLAGLLVDDMYVGKREIF